jgi:hypothetical protein
MRQRVAGLHGRVCIARFSLQAVVSIHEVPDSDDVLVVAKLQPNIAVHSRGRRWHFIPAVARRESGTRRMLTCHCSLVRESLAVGLGVWRSLS